MASFKTKIETNALILSKFEIKIKTNMLELQFSNPKQQPIMNLEVFFLSNNDVIIPIFLACHCLNMSENDDNFKFYVEIATKSFEIANFCSKSKSKISNRLRGIQNQHQNRKFRKFSQPKSKIQSKSVSFAQPCYTVLFSLLSRSIFKRAFRSRICFHTVVQ